MSGLAQKPQLLQEEIKFICFLTKYSNKRLTISCLCDIFVKTPKECFYTVKCTSIFIINGL